MIFRRRSSSFVLNPRSDFSFGIHNASRMLLPMIVCAVVCAENHLQIETRSLFRNIRKPWQAAAAVTSATDKRQFASSALFSMFVPFVLCECREISRIIVRFVIIIISNKVEEAGQFFMLVTLVTSMSDSKRQCAL